MKKIFLLFFSLTLLTSCSKDDENTNTGPDPILGVWFISEVNNPFSNDGELSECNKQSSIEFTDDQNATTIFFDDDSGECESTTTTSTWKNLGDSNYEIVIPEFGKQTGKVDFTGTTSFQFNPSNFPGVSIVFKK
jgi:hypothetical protein